MLCGQPTYDASVEFYVILLIVSYEINLGKSNLKERKIPLLAILAATVIQTTMSLQRYLCLEVVSRSASVAGNISQAWWVRNLVGISQGLLNTT